MGGHNAEIQDLRGQILKSLVPLMVNADIPPEQKFALQLSIAETSGDASRFREAFETASRMGDDTSKTNALLDLLNAIDAQPETAPEGDNHQDDQASANFASE